MAGWLLLFVLLLAQPRILQHTVPQNEPICYRRRGIIILKPLLPVLVDRTVTSPSSFPFLVCGFFGFV